MSNYFEDYHELLDVEKQLRRDFDWNHASIRELYFVNGYALSYLEDRAEEPVTGEICVGTNLRFTVDATDNNGHSGLEFLCRGVDDFQFTTLGDGLLLRCKKDGNSSIALDLVDPDYDFQAFYLSAKRIQVRMLAEGHFKQWPQLGYEFPSNNTEPAKTLDGPWRQCGKCGDAWEENPIIEYARCPTCGCLTKLEA